MIRRRSIGLAAVLATTLAVPAQALTPFAGSIGLSGFPSFIWAGPAVQDGATRWEGNHFSVWSGFSVTRSGGRTVASPELGLSAGRNWRDGNFVWGVELAGAFSPATSRISGPALPAFAEYDRHFSGIARVKGGLLLTDTVLLYGSLGAVAVNESWKLNPALAAVPGLTSRDNVRVAPDIRAGVQWAVTPSLSLNLEVGAQPAW